jgi:hypothetical protein
MLCETDISTLKSVLIDSSNVTPDKASQIVLKHGVRLLHVCVRDSPKASLQHPE